MTSAGYTYTYTSMTQIDDLEKARVIVLQEHEFGHQSVDQIRQWANVVWDRRLNPEFYNRDLESDYVVATVSAGLILIALKLLLEEGVVADER